MRTLLPLIFLFFSQNSSIGQVVRWGDYGDYPKIDTVTTVLKETIHFDLDGDKFQDTILINNLASLEGDPEEFSEVVIRFGNGRQFEIRNVEGYFFDTSVVISGLVLSEGKYIRIIQGPGKNNSIFLNGYAYPSCQDHFMIISIAAVHDYKVENFKDFSVAKIVTVTSTGAIDITGVKPCTEKVLTHQFTF